MKILKKIKLLQIRTIVDNDITSSYELNQRPNRLATDTCTLRGKASNRKHVNFRRKKSC